MKNLTAKTFLVALLALAASTAVSQNQDNQGQNDNNQGWSGAPTRVPAPEINPAEAMAALTLLGGAVAIVRGYRRRKK
jgi:hypothetical protein